MSYFLVRGVSVACLFVIAGALSLSAMAQNAGRYHDKRKQTEITMLVKAAPAGEKVDYLLEGKYSDPKQNCPCGLKGIYSSQDNKLDAKIVDQNGTAVYVLVGTWSQTRGGFELSVADIHHKIVGRFLAKRVSG